MSDIQGYDRSDPKSAGWVDRAWDAADFNHMEDVERRAEADYWASVDRDNYERAVAEEEVRATE